MGNPQSVESSIKLGTSDTMGCYGIGHKNGHYVRQTECLLYPPKARTFSILCSYPINQRRIICHRRELLTHRHTGHDCKERY